MDLQSLDVNTNNPFDLLFTISNTGKAPATLMRIENMARSKLEGVATSGIYSFKGNNVDLKEKRLPPSTTEEITITINPLAKGEYKIKPRIIFLSDTNESVSYELKTIDLKVTDLGLADWLRGPLIKEKTRSKR